MIISEEVQRNKALVWEFWQELNRSQPAEMGQVVRRYVDAAISWHGPHPINDLDGAEAVVSGFWEPLRTAFPDFSLTIEEMVEAGDKVWARMTARGTNRGGFMGPPNGKSFEIAVFDVCRFEEGKIIEHWGSPDRFAMLAQLGLLAQPEPAKV